MALEGEKSSTHTHTHKSVELNWNFLATIISD